MDLDSNLPKTMADSTQIDQVFTNLILNACHAIGATSVNGGTITIKTRRGTRDDIEAVISDTGHRDKRGRRAQDLTRSSRRSPRASAPDSGSRFHTES